MIRINHHISIEENILERLTVFSFSILTTNGLERINREIYRRRGVMGIFPNEASHLKLLSAMLMLSSKEWEVGRKLLNMKENMET